MKTEKQKNRLSRREMEPEGETCSWSSVEEAGVAEVKGAAQM